MNRLLATLIAFFIASVAASDAARAHTRSQSFSVWTLSGAQASFTFSVDARRLTQIAPHYPNARRLDVLFERHLRETISVRQTGATCRLESLSAAGEGAGVLTAHGYFTCDEDFARADGAARILAFQEASPTHVHIARLAWDGGSRETVLRRGRASLALSLAETPQSITDFISLGFHHVLSGLDHLVFLLALALAAPRLRTAVFCVTGFTIGHSITLGLAAGGLISPNERLVEAIIGFTIAAAALEAGAARGLARTPAFLIFSLLTACIALAQAALGGAAAGAGLLLAAYLAIMARAPAEAARRLLPATTAIFGLAHGAGFAGALIETNIEPHALAAPLLGFNIGVELAQLTALAIIMAGLFTVRQLFTAPTPRLAMEHAASAGLVGLGVFWFAERLLA